MAESTRIFLAVALPALISLDACGPAAHDGSSSSFSSSGSQHVTATSDGGSSASTSGVTGFPTMGGMLGGDAGYTALADSGLAATATGAAGGGCGGDGGSAVITVTIRDFKMFTAGGTNPDFQNALGADTGIVAPALGTDQKPVYANPGGMTRTTHGQMYFDQWYHDTPGVNINVQYPVPLTSGAGGTCGYDSLVSGVPNTLTGTRGWFPIDDGTPYMTAFGNQGEPHNYSFTTELHTVFTYNGGEAFTFSGDDDVFVFIDKKLVIDMGGVHPRSQATIAVDSLGLTRGQQYPLDLFNAERRMIDSNFSFTTTLQLRAAPPPPR